MYDISRHTSHPNIVRLLTVEAPHLRPTNTILRDASNSSSAKRGRPTDHSLDDLYLVFELVDTDLNKLLLSSQYLSTLHIQTFLYQILLGMLYLHSANIIHR
jgi:serine/threonine protein kinase